MRIPKSKPSRNKKYLAWLKGQPCEICGDPGEPHHVRRSYWGAGIEQKSTTLCVTLRR